MTFFIITLAIWVIPMKKLCKPSFKKKDYGQGAGIPVLKTVWDLFDLSLLFSQTGIRKPSGRLSRLQERTETRLTDGDIVALDDTKAEHRPCQTDAFRDSPT